MRNLQGYGPEGAQIRWPNNARIAINFVINYEEGAELTPVNGDEQAEIYGGELAMPAKPKGMRNLSMESLFEYGSRAGIWRLIRLFDKKAIPLTFFACGLALTLNPALCHYLQHSPHEVAGHGWRWIDYTRVPVTLEKKHILKCIDTLQDLTAKTVEGWYTGRKSTKTTQIIQSIPSIKYHSDSYADDVPYFDEQQLIIPYTLDCNDFKLISSPGYCSHEAFVNYLKSTLSYLYQENRPSMMTIGIHPRISGHPGRTQALEQFIDFIAGIPDVWIARRIDIAQHWLATQSS